jgi:putative transcriptional regulator
MGYACVALLLRPCHRKETLRMKNRIRELREARNITQEELARRLEVSRQTVNAIENDKYDPMLPLAFRIAKVFGRRIEDIFQPEKK